MRFCGCVSLVRRRRQPLPSPVPVSPASSHQALPVARKSLEGGACGLIRALLLYCHADLAIDRKRWLNPNSFSIRDAEAVHGGSFCRRHDLHTHRQYGCRAASHSHRHGRFPLPRLLRPFPNPLFVMFAPSDITTIISPPIRSLYAVPRVSSPDSHFSFTHFF